MKRLIELCLETNAHSWNKKITKEEVEKMNLFRLREWFFSKEFEEVFEVAMDLSWTVTEFTDIAKAVLIKEWKLDEVKDV